AGPTGRPEVLYVGAEYCPYCAAERWSLIVALSRFGTFSGVRPAASSATDVFPSTPTFTFAGATYTSPYVDLVAIEQDAGGAGRPAPAVPAPQRDLMQRHGGGIPFIDFGNRAVVTGATYSPGMLQGMSQHQVAVSLQDLSSQQARAILGSANLLTAAICLATEQRPADVCSSAGVLAASAHL
ncbi:MAG TPA: DUF929 family protein, partial [Candidatus Eisenbacteria bacterium]|nr:DUF929 family protein [Candidatus Eisenbacteria bacterium]